MNKEKKVTYRVLASLLIVFGIILAVEWGTPQFCIGDILFSAVGLSAWSNGIGGIHYPGVIGTLLSLCGIGLFHYTLQKDSRKCIWELVFLFLIAIKLIYLYIYTAGIGQIWHFLSVTYWRTLTCKNFSSTIESFIFQEPYPTKGGPPATPPHCCGGV